MNSLQFDGCDSGLLASSSVTRDSCRASVRQGTSSANGSVDHTEESEGNTGCSRNEARVFVHDQDSRFQASRASPKERDYLGIGYSLSHEKRPLVDMEDQEKIHGSHRTNLGGTELKLAPPGSSDSNLPVGILSASDLVGNKRVPQASTHRSVTDKEDLTRQVGGNITLRNVILTAQHHLDTSSEAATFPSSCLIDGHDISSNITPHEEAAINAACPHDRENCGSTLFSNPYLEEVLVGKKYRSDQPSMRDNKRPRYSLISEQKPAQFTPDLTERYPDNELKGVVKPQEYSDSTSFGMFGLSAKCKSDQIADRSCWLQHSKARELSGEPCTETKTDVAHYHKSKQLIKPAAQPCGQEAARQRDDVVGWPPLNSYRKSSTHGPFAKGCEGSECLCWKSTPPADQDTIPATDSNSNPSARIKVSMDGAPFMRKLDLSSLKGYHDLCEELENLFDIFATNRLLQSHVIPADSGRLFLHGHQYVLTYEDSEGDWMLAGDIPWEIFSHSARKIRIMKRSALVDDFT